MRKNEFHTYHNPKLHEEYVKSKQFSWGWSIALLVAAVVAGASVPWVIKLTQ